MQDGNNKLLTTEEVAEELKVHVKTVRDWIASGELEAIDLGQGYRIWKSDLRSSLTVEKDEGQIARNNQMSIKNK